MHRAPVATTSPDFFPSSHTDNNYDVSSYSLREGPGPCSDSQYDKSHEGIRSSGSSAIRPDLSQITSVYFEPLLKHGLRTPPSDKMNSTASYSQQYNSYSGRKDNPYTTSFASHSKASELYAGPVQPGREPKTTDLSSVRGTAALSYPQRHSPQITGTAVLAPEDVGHRKSVIQPSLQIPASINNSGGSLGEFAAQITCLFWFESTGTLRRAEEWTTASSPVRRLVPDAIPTVSFRKWVVTILSTTQVTPNVILLALLFIYRLKTLNPTVKGKAGSEYRLLTVALMLGNKFLDDNTYTNKTWAEVSGISVGEIHVMEVEFLSNMRYSLLASKDQWKEWQAKLGKFWDYFERAARAAPTLPSPVAMNHPTMLPSPPGSLETSPPALTTYSPNSAPHNYNHTWPVSYGQPLVSPLPSMPDLVPELNLQPSARKRGYEEPTDEPPAKRITRTSTQHVIPQATIPVPRQGIPRLPVPGLSLTTNQINGYPIAQQNLPLLPPLVGVRAMSTVYPVTPSWTPQSQASLTPTVATTHGGSQSVNASSNYGTPSRRQSPRSLQGVISMSSSPISGNFPGSSHNVNSPSFFLQQRSSPYKPVRLPNTLLYPPPSASMHNYSTNVEQMHYQPLGKRNDYRSGIVPEYVSHPAYQGWPALPQPNFQS